MSTVEDLFAQRKALAERFSVAPVAFSTDGREVGIAGPIDLGVAVGALALVEMPDDGQLVIQVRDLVTIEREGLTHRRRRHRCRVGGGERVRATEVPLADGLRNRARTSRRGRFLCPRGGRAVR